MSGGARRRRYRWAPSSVRLRLLLGLGILLVVGLVSSSVTSALLLNHFLHNRLITTLQDDANRVQQTLSVGPQRVDGEQISALLGPPFGILTVDNAGRPLTSTGSAQLAPQELARLATQSSTGSVVSYQIPHGHHLSAIRIPSPGLIVTRGAENTIRPAALILCVDTSVDNGTVRDLVVRLLVVVGAALALLLGLGLLVVRVGMRPLSRMASTADEIAAGSLADRLPVRGDRSETDRLAVAVNNAFDAQARAEASARSFAADASHELRTPVSVISGWMELYRQGHLDAEATSTAMEHVDDEVGRIRLLVEELGLLARLDAGRPIGRDMVDLAGLAHSVVEDAQVIYPDRAITLHAEPGIHSTGDPARLQQVLRNLVGNAVEHTPQPSAVEVTVEQTATAAQITVSDNGPGIAATDLPRVFERFWRAEASRSRAYGGSGLGLAIVEAIVRAHHGRVRVDSTVGVGTTVTVTLPRARGAAAAPSGSIVK